MITLIQKGKILLLHVSVCVVICMFGVSTLFGGPVSSYAQTAQQAQTQTATVDSSVEPGVNVFGSLGFSDCRIVEQNSRPNSSQLQKCVVQIVQFFFIVALFVVGLRIAIEALSGLNPFNTGKAIDNSVKLVQDIIIGLLLLGSPAILLTIFSTTTLNINSLLNLNTNSGNTSTSNNSTPASNTPQNQNPAQNARLITISGFPIPLGTSLSSLTDENERAGYTTTIQSIASNLRSGSAIRNIDGNVSLQDLVNAINQSGVFAGNESITQTHTALLNMNQQIQSATISKIANNANTYTIKRSNCTTQADCNYTALLVNSNNGCNSIFDTQSSKIVNSSTFPTSSCYFIKSDSN